MEKSMMTTNYILFNLKIDTDYACEKEAKNIWHDPIAIQDYQHFTYGSWFLAYLLKCLPILKKKLHLWKMRFAKWRETWVALKHMLDFHSQIMNLKCAQNWIIEAAVSCKSHLKLCSKTSMGRQRHSLLLSPFHS